MGILDYFRSKFAPEQASIIWPPTSERARLQKYERHRAIFDGHHVSALDEQGIANRYGQFVTVNVAKVIVIIPADILFGEEISLEYPDDVDEKAKEQCEEIWKRTNLKTLLYESAIDTGIEGDSVIAVDRGEDGLAAFRSIPVSTWFPELDPDDVQQEIAHVIAWKRTFTDAQGHERNFLRINKHEKGKITYQLWRLNREGKLDGEASAAEWTMLYPNGRPPVEVNTGLEDDFALVHIPNFRTSNTYHGHGEFEFGVESIFAAIDALFTQGSYILGKHADPMLALPQETFIGMQAQAKAGAMNPKTRVTTVGMIDKANLDVVSMGDNNSKPEYVTYDGQITSNIELADSLLDKLALITEIAPQLLNKGEGLSGELSGRALKILLLRTLAKVNRKRQYYNQAIPKLMELAQRVEGVKEPIQVTVAWKDGLPQDQIETIEAQEKMVKLGVQPKIDAAMAVHDCDRDVAEEKVKNSDEEQAAARDAENESMTNAVIKQRDKQAFGKVAA